MNLTFAAPPTLPAKTQHPISPKPGADRAHTVPCSELYETANGFELIVELPGVTRENLSITIENGLLRLNAKRTAQALGKPIISETQASDFAREFRLGSTIDTHAITALLEQGVLRLRLPKLPESQLRHIPLLPPETN